MIDNSSKILLIDDDPSIRKSLSTLLQSMGYEVETMGSAEEFIEKKHCSTRYGCVLLDICMPGMNGMDLQAELNKIGDSMPIIFITGYAEIPMCVKAMKNGAIDFLEKPFDDEQLLQAIETAYEKGKIDRKTQEELSCIKKDVETLTPREYEVLRYISTGLLNKQIAAEMDIAEQTVKIHRGRVMKKLNITTVVDLVRIADTAMVAQIYDEQCN